MVRLDSSSPAELLQPASGNARGGSRSNLGARPAGRTGAQSSSQQAARISNGATVQSAVSSSAVSASEDDQKTREGSQDSFNSIFREYDGDGDDSQPDAKDDQPKKDDSNSSNTLTAPVATPAPLKEILPMVFALPRPISAIGENSAAASSAGASNAATNNVATASIAQLQIDDETESAGSDANPGATASVAPPPPPPLPESAPIIPRGDVAFTAKLMQDPQDAAKPDAPKPATLSAHAAQQQPLQAIQAAVQKTIISPAIPEMIAEKIAEPILRVATMPQEVNAASHSSAASKLDTTLPLNAAAAISKLADAIDVPPAPPNSANEITVRIPDATDRGTDVRFVERAGEINVTVRTTDSEMAQSLRSGLGDLSARLEQNGIRAEMWKPGSDNSQSQDESSRRWNDQKNANSQRQAADSEDNQKNSKRPKWVEALELSLGGKA